MTVGTIAFSALLGVLSGVQGLYSRDAAGMSGDGNHLTIYTQKELLIARVQSEGEEVKLIYKGLEADEEAHIAFSFDGSTVGLYVDGELVDEAESTFTQANSPEETQFGAIGWYDESGSGDFDKVLDGTLSNI